jgi:hypothetical protein
LLLPADAEAQRAFARQFQAQLSHTVEDRILNQQTRFVRRLRQSLYDGWKPGQPFKPRSGVVLGERRSDTKAS